MATSADASPDAQQAKDTSPTEAVSPKVSTSRTSKNARSASGPTTSGPAYLHFPLPARPSNEPGTLVRLDCMTKQWYRVDKSEKIPTPLRPLDPPLPPVHPDVELRRAELHNQLKREMQKLCKYAGVPFGKPQGLFERWLWTQLCVQPEEADPLLPFSATDQEPRFEAELADFNVSTAEARFILKNISASSTEACRKLRVVAKDTSSEKTQISITPHPYRRDAVEVCYKKKKLELNDEHFRKLKRLYYREITSENEQEFRCDLFCMLLRYYTLGGDAYQAAVPPQVFRFFQKKLDVEQECFASPLNCYFDRLCSALPDTDSRFGSVGSFFEFTPDSGSFEANPPFTEVSMQRMAEHIDFLLARTTKALSFLVVVPRWDDAASPMWTMMSESPFFVRRIDVPKHAHQYCKGYQHYLDSKFWVASHETCVFILQNEAGKEKYCANDEFEKKLLRIWRTTSSDEHVGHKRKRSYSSDPFDDRPRRSREDRYESHRDSSRRSRRDSSPKDSRRRSHRHRSSSYEDRSYRKSRRKSRRDDSPRDTRRRSHRRRSSRDDSPEDTHRDSKRRSHRDSSPRDSRRRSRRDSR
ncbi:hypothetical protein V7S43_008978 [Phytophthora oleae]|uniref:PCIF1 WW domain-containing protein n=1 Tax=Phytophthora oleae TaxID=2107226 RepID=A0ABD3FKS1_9STRA